MNTGDPYGLIEKIRVVQNRPRRVLFIDDSKEDLELFAAQSKPFAVTVDQATSGAEGLAKSIEENYDLIFLDLAMPGGMDGLTTFRAIKGAAKALGRLQRVIILTGALVQQLKNHEELLNQIMSDGQPVFFVQKPVVFTDGIYMAELFNTVGISRLPLTQCTRADCELRKII